MSDKLILENGILKILSNNEWEIYPKKEDRKEILLKAHLLSHFEESSTIDRLSKYFWKNRSKLWLWISNYGPPEELLTDMGKEFINSIVQNLIDNIGTERRVTSAYNPRTDGLCECANQTIINILKKHVEADPLNWDKWISYVE